MTRVELDSAGMRDLLTSPGVRADLQTRAERAAAAARAAAPVDTGAYRASIRVETEVHGDRVVSRIVADVDYAMGVEAKTGTLARSLDFAGGA